MKKPNVLKEILQFKEKEVAERKRKQPLSNLKKRAKPAGTRPFFEEISTKKRPINLVAEVKRASPSQGLLREKFDLQEIVSAYSRHAQAISVLTDEKVFQGSMEHLKQVKNSTTLPVLQKDFIIDEYQLYEARALGADAILLIAAALSKSSLKKLYSTARKAGLQCVVEVHNSGDMEKALSIRPNIFGINNRDLESLKVDLNTTIGLAGMVPEGKAIVSESGFSSPAEIQMVRGKADAVLIGSAFMKAETIEQKIMEMGF